MLELPPADQRYLEAVETLPRAQLLALQQQRLLRMIDYAYQRSAFIRHHWDAVGLRPRGPMFRLMQTLGITPIMLGYGEGDLQHFIDLSRRYRPTLFYAMTAFLGAGLQDIERSMGIDMRDVFASYKGILFAGEPVGPRLRQTFERWGLAGKIFNQTSFGDLG